MAENLDISLLMERLSAQTEVHSKYTEAFVKIIGILDDIKHNATAIHQSDSEQFRNLLERHISLSEHLKAVIDEIKEIVRTNTSSIQSLNIAINEATTETSNEIREQFDAVKKTLVKRDNELTILISKCAESINAIQKQIKDIQVHDRTSDTNDEEYKKILASIELQLKHLNTSVDALQNVSKGWQAIKDRWKGYAVVAIVILGIIETLIQLGILQLTWLTDK